MKTRPLRASLTLLAALAALAGPGLPRLHAQPAPEADFATVAAEARQAIDAKLAALAAGEEVPGRFDWTALDGQFDDLVRELPTLGPQEARNRLRALADNVKSPEAKALVARLGAPLESGLKAAEAERQSAFERTLAETSTAALAATSATQIDPLIETVEALQAESNNRGGNRQSRNNDLINRQQNFLNLWLNLLLGVADGDANAVRNAENNLSGGYARAHGVTRGQVRTRLRELSATLSAGEGPDALLATLDLDTLEQVRTALLAETDGMGWNHAGNYRSYLANSLDQIRLATLSLDAGDTELALRQFGGGGGVVVFHGTPTSSGFVPLQRLRTAWLARELPRLTGLKDVAPPTEGEFPDPYLRRLVLAADAADDLPRAAALARVLARIEARPQGFGRTDPEENLAAAFAHYAAGRRLEDAGQGAEAAKSYHLALIAGAPAGLTREIARRLPSLGVPPTP